MVGMFLSPVLALGENVATGKSVSTDKRAAIASSTKPIQKPKPKTRSQERLAAIISERADILSSRWNALADRLMKISERLASRLDKMEQSGFDATTALTLLETANNKIEAARTRGEEAADKIVARALDSDGTASDLYKIEKLVINPEKDTVSKAFQEAKDALDDVVLSLPR